MPDVNTNGSTSQFYNRDRPLSVKVDVTGQPDTQLLNCQHSLQCDETPFGNLGVDLDLVDDRSVTKIFQRPTEMWQIDPVHRGTHAHDRAEEMNFLLGMLGL